MPTTRRTCRAHSRPCRWGACGGRTGLSKGRFRQFVQCDIDILGDATSLAEIELILATTTALGKICPDNAFTVRINDREILRGMALSCGFAEESLEQVFITLDKMDKIGLEGVKAELLENGCSQESVDRYAALLSSVGKDAQGVRRLGEALEGVMPRQGDGEPGRHHGHSIPGGRDRLRPGV